MKKVNVIALMVIVIAGLLLSGCGLISESWHEHKFDIKQNEETHYYECACGEKIEEECHKYKWIVDKAATESETGLTHRECEVCGMVSHENTVVSVLDCEEVSATWLIDGDMQPSPPFFGYKIFVDKNRHSYENVFDIYVRDIYPWYEYAVKDGLFSIKLEESPYFEIIGASEYSVPDYNASNNMNMEFKFTVKATYPCSLPEWFVFKIKCEYDKEKEQELRREAIYMDCNFDEEYFFTIKDLLYINDSEGMILGESGRKIFYDSLNREYLNHVIESKTEYFSRVFEFESGDKPYISVDADDTYISYQSKNIKVRLYLSQEYLFLYDKFLQHDSNLNKDIAIDILNIMVENNVIPTAVYEKELQYIETREIGRGGIHIAYGFIIFEDFNWGNMPEYIYEENQENVENIYNCVEGNSAQLYLEDEIVPVGSVK